MKIDKAAREESADRSAGAPPAVAGATRPRFGSVKIRDRGRLPHWEMESATYFVTFRLADSLPKSILDRIASEKHSIETTTRQLHRALTPDEQKKLHRLSSPIIERYLDTGVGLCQLRVPAIADEMARTLRLFNERRYRLFAWVIMPNHVHVVFKAFPGNELPRILHSWKSYTAKCANHFLGQQGPFWQREYYDHLIRNEAELERAIHYVEANPEKANLKHWKWLWIYGQDARTTAAEDGGATNREP